MNPIEFVKVGSRISNFRWAIRELGVVSQSRFACEADAQIAYRNYLLGRRA